MTIEEKIKQASDSYANWLLIKGDIFSQKFVRRAVKIAFEEGCNFMNASPQKYILVQWPDSQYLMDDERFHECLFVQDMEGHNEVGDSAYMVPENLFYEYFDE